MDPQDLSPKFGNNTLFHPQDSSCGNSTHFAPTGGMDAIATLQTWPTIPATRAD
eukprot:COSAG01_NODE_65531_length_273_cov_0.586207_1_plen_53_part_01